jgi:ABC-type nitrate/sulfonate/bicarbonate transport system substrate-binding protein
MLRPVVGLVIAAVLAAACAGGQSQTPPASTAPSATPLTLLPMKIGVYDPPNLLTFAMDTTDDMGLFRKNGLDATLVRAAVLALPPLYVSGQIDLLCGTGSFFAQTFAGQRPLAVAGNGAAQPYTMISRNEITSIAGLKGRTFAVPILNTSSIYLLAAHVLQQNGMKPSDVNFVQIQDQKTYIPALVAGRIDATMVDPADLLVASAESSLHTLEKNPGKGFNILPVNECFVRPEWAATHKTEIVRFVKSFMQAQRVLDTDKAAHAKALQTRFPGRYTDSQAASLFQIQHDQGWWTVNGGLETEWLKSSLDFYATLQSTPPQAVAPDAVMTTEYLKAALDEIGVVPSTTDKATWYKKP